MANFDTEKDNLILELKTLKTLITNIKNASTNLKSQLDNETSAYDTTSLETKINAFKTSLDALNSTLYRIFLKSSSDTTPLMLMITNFQKYLFICDFSSYSGDNELKDTYRNYLFDIPKAYYNVSSSASDIYLTAEHKILPYLKFLNNIPLLTASETDTYNNNIQKFSDERYDYEDHKYEVFLDLNNYMTMDKTLHIQLKYTQAIIDRLMADLNSIETVILPDLNETITSIDTKLISHMDQKRSTHGIFSLSNYERKVYNYTYLTERIRLKYEFLDGVNINIGLIDDKITELEAKPIPDYNLINKFKALKDSYISIKNSVEFELKAMIEEYNNMRLHVFGLEAITLGDKEFDDGGISNPNLPCFMNADLS